jgi:hypothetical protein
LQSLAEAGGYEPTPHTLSELAALGGSLNKGFKVVVDRRQDDCNMFQRVRDALSWVIPTPNGWLKRTARTLGAMWFDNSHDFHS